MKGFRSWIPTAAMGAVDVGAVVRFEGPDEEDVRTGFPGRAVKTVGRIGDSGKRATRCAGGACWNPNRFGWCKVCGGNPPGGERPTPCSCEAGRCCAAHGLHREPHTGCIVTGEGGQERRRRPRGRKG